MGEWCGNLQTYASRYHERYVTLRRYFAMICRRRDVTLPALHTKEAEIADAITYDIEMFHHRDVFAFTFFLARRYGVAIRNMVLIETRLQRYSGERGRERQDMI